VVNADLTTSQDRWPSFGEQARSVGYLSVHALPLRRHATVIGALNLFCARDSALSRADVRTGQALADVATIGLLAQRTLHKSETLATQLQQALESRVTIEQAKGVLAERRHINVDEAFALLRGHARRHNLRLTDLARQVADGSCTAFDQPHGPAPKTP
jgi:transcriptional regulator with GAF, ATPase, and Fis domain